ncbi:LamG-like jellyroll fold domain-containing protein [Streptomyces sp. NPDC051740]|uniref:LamG domain-containing protein n=1 Tax=Streptomyces sp. NPDC051740 TaxID=3365673 RepID=UPI00378C89AF
MRPAATDTPMTVAGQDAADGTSAFTLGLRPTADSPATWAFRYGATTLTGGKASAGGWAHLTGLYDTEDNTLRLYVNGKEAASETGVAPVDAPGAFQIGRDRGDGGARRQGEIGDVRVWDRVVPREEIEELVPAPPNWPPPGTSSGPMTARSPTGTATSRSPRTAAPASTPPTTMPASKTPSASISRRAPSTATTT